MIWQRAAGRAKLCIIAILCFVLVLQGNMVVLANEVSLQLSSPSVILMEASTGTVLYEKNPDEVRSPASITKIMTLLLTFEALEKGPLAGYPVINVHATLFDGKYHAVDSNELSFKMAAILAFKEAYKNCRPVLLEPIMRVKISVQEQYLGDVISDVSQRRGRISGMENSGELQLVEAFIPEAEIIDYKIDLSSMTQGNGKFSREFYGYEEVPAHLVDAIIAESQK